MGDEKIQEQYVVRGALLACTYGSHPRRINLMNSHGVYVDGHPVIHINDCVVDQNISYFGVCKSEIPPENAKTICLEGYKKEGESEPGPDVQGPKCCPVILGPWQKVHSNSCITGEFPAVTTDSYLVCSSCCGLIYPVTSGQEYKDK